MHMAPLQEIITVAESVIDDAYERAARLFTENRLDDAVDMVTGELDQRPDDGRLWELLGTLAYAKENFELAVTAIERASLMIPLAPRAQLVLGKCYDRAGFRESATAIYCHLATLPDLAGDLLAALAAGLGRCGECELALQVCRRAAASFPGRADPHLGIVHYMRRLRRPVKQILPSMFRAHHLEPENVEYRVRLAWMLHESGCSAAGAYLLEGVDCEEFSCIRCLTLMQTIFDSVGDKLNANACRQQLAILANDWVAGEDDDG